jgi:hypothetical protein
MYSLALLYPSEPQKFQTVTCSEIRGRNQTLPLGLQVQRWAVGCPPILGKTFENGEWPKENFMDEPGSMKQATYDGKYFPVFARFVIWTR